MTTIIVNPNIGEVENTIPDTSGLVPATVLNTKIGKDENKISDVSGLVKKTYYNAKISDTEAKYFTTVDYRKFPSEILKMKIKQTNLRINRDINAVPHYVNKNEEKTEKQQKFDLSYFLGKSFFGDNGFQNVFPNDILRYI